MKAKRELTKEEYKQAMDYKKAHGLPSLLSAVGVLFPDAVIFEKGDIKKSPVKVKAESKKEPEKIRTEKPEEYPAAVQTEKPKKKYLEAGDRDKAGNIITEKKAAALEQFRSYTPEEVEKVKGEIINQSAEIPQDMIDGVQNALYDFVDLKLEKLDDSESPERCFRRYIKDSAQIFGAFCFYVGDYYTKKYKVLHDETYKAYGGVRYDARKVDALSTIYLEYCDFYGVAPQMMNMCKFMGISREYVRQSVEDVNYKTHLEKDGSGAGATSALIDLRQKLKLHQEGVFTGYLTEGKRQAAGTIFASKNLTGWEDEPNRNRIEVLKVNSSGYLPDLTALGLKDE